MKAETSAEGNNILSLEQLPRKLACGTTQCLRAQHLAKRIEQDQNSLGQAFGGLGLKSKRSE